MQQGWSLALAIPAQTAACSTARPPMPALCWPTLHATCQIPASLHPHLHFRHFVQSQAVRVHEGTPRSRDSWLTWTRAAYLRHPFDARCSPLPPYRLTAAPDGVFIRSSATYTCFSLEGGTTYCRQHRAIELACPLHDAADSPADYQPTRNHLPPPISLSSASCKLMQPLPRPKWKTNSKRAP